MLDYEPAGRTFYIENLGCSKNQVDAEVIIGNLSDTGWTRVSRPEDAEFILVNTCGFIEPAKKESIDTTLSLRKLFPDKKVVMTGCLAQRYGENLLEQIPELDGVFGNRDLSQVESFMNRAESGERLAVLPSVDCFSSGHSESLSFPGSAYVKISEGCNHRCSYCAIPVIRGNLRSRTIDDVINEIKSLLTKGVFEINLIAQDLAAFGTEKKHHDFVPLLRGISKIPGDFWIRLLYIHPDDFPDEIMDIMENDRRFLPYFDIPFQHASGRVLKAMGRKGDKNGYLNLIKTIRSRLPDAVIRSTFMIGFPFEGSRERRELVSFLREASLDWAGFFVYSREEDTKAYEMRGKFAHWMAVRAAERFKPKLMRLQENITQARMEKFKGKILDVLVEEKVEGESVFFGRAYLHAPEVDGSVVVLSGECIPGRVVPCRIIKRNGIDLEAVPLDEL